MTRKGYVHSEEQYLEMYTRLALEPEDFEDEEAFRAKLRQQLGYEPTEEQVRTQGKFFEYGIERFQELGIAGITYRKQIIGPSVRYQIPGYRGAYSWRSVQDYMYVQRLKELGVIGVEFVGTPIYP